MQIDKPKALYELKEFLRYIFVVVVGVPTARSLEEAVHALRDRAAGMLEHRIRGEEKLELGHHRESETCNP